MTIFNKKGVPELLTLGITFLILLCIYHEVVLHPNDYLFSAWGDGVKNYYAYLYHAQYDDSFWNFSGMNYPYGENIVYTDGHPLLSWLIGVFGLTNYGVGILNLFMLLSYPACAFFLYKILSHFKVPTLWSISAAVAITFLSPQVFRMTGHFSLSYVFAVPGMWYLLIKSNSPGTWKWVVLTFIYLTIFFFTHPYLGLILASFGTSFWLVNSVLNKEWGVKMLKFFCGTLLPILFFQILVSLTDTHAGRTGEPQGFFDYCANWYSLLVPHHGPMIPVRDLFGLTAPNWETLAYVGFGSMLLCSVVLVRRLRAWREFSFRQALRDELTIFLLAAWLVLLFSFCFPFKYEILRPMADNIGPLKQFRVLGRFTWIFFYVITVAVAVWFHRSNIAGRSRSVFSAIFIAAVALNFFEAIPVHIEIATAVSQSPNAFKEENLIPDLREIVDFVKSQESTALLVTPFQHMSSENIMLLAPEEVNFDALMLSYHCRLPLVNSITSRLSVVEAIKVNNLFSPDYIEKEYVYDVPEDAKILIVHRKMFVKEGEQRMLDRSELIFENALYAVHELKLADWNNRKYFDAVMSQNDSARYDVGNGFRSDTSDVWYVYESFEKDTGESLSGNGAVHGKKEFTNILYEMKGEFEPGKYIVNFWYYLGIDAPTMLAVVDMDYKGNRKSEWITQFDVKESTLIVENWCRIRMQFEWTEESEKATIFLNGSGNKKPFYVDELMIRKKDGPDLFKREIKNGREYLSFDNDWIRADSFSK